MAFMIFIVFLCCCVIVHMMYSAQTSIKKNLGFKAAKIQHNHSLNNCSGCFGYIRISFSYVLSLYFFNCMLDCANS